MFLSVVETEEEIEKRCRIEEALQKENSLDIWQKLALDRFGLVGGLLHSFYAVWLSL